MAKYDPKTEKGECLFCKIADREFHTPGIFWEDDCFMAFLTIFPNMPGVTVLIPKAHYGSDVLGMSEDVLHEFISAAKKVSDILLSHFPDVGRVGLIMEGTGIDHAHIKLYPMHGTGHMKDGVWKQYPSGVDTYFDKYAGYIASNDGPKADEDEIWELAERLRNID